MNFKEDIRLENERVLLRPFELSDLKDLEEIALDENIWQFTVSRIHTLEELNQWGQDLIANREREKNYAFSIVDKATGKVIGSTSFLNISAPDKRLEIGSTFLGKNYHGTGLNKVCKFLLLSYIFEELKYERAELKTDVPNLRSRKAMLKIGATEEGILRSHTQMYDNRRRDTVYYSILAPEWPALKQTIFADLLQTVQ